VRTIRNKNMIHDEMEEESIRELLTREEQRFGVFENKVVKEIFERTTYHLEPLCSQLPNI